MPVTVLGFLRSSVIALAGTALWGAAAHAACPAADHGLKLPDGFCASIFAEDIGHARHMAISAEGVVYVNTWSGRYYANTKAPPQDGGFLVALQDTKGTGKADVIKRFGETPQTGAAGGTGIGLYNGYLYVESNDKIVRYAMSKGAIVPSGAPQTIVSGMPLEGDHPMHPFAIDGGSLYVDLGTATNACQVKNRTLKSPGVEPCVESETRGGIWRFDANKLDQVFSPAQRYATGIRNAEGFGVDTAGHRIFITQHGRDQLHANWPELYPADQEATLPSEEVMLLTKGGDYGWPKCYYDPYQSKLVLAPEYGGDGGKAVGGCASKTGPVAAFPAHWAPNGMTYYDKKQFPSRYRNGLFIAFHGSWDRAPYAQAGYNVVFQSLSGDQAGGRCAIFADGFAGAGKATGKADHRPNGLSVAPDGALFVSDDSTGRIYRITYTGKGEASGPVTACPDLTAAPGPVLAGNKPPVLDPDTKAAALAPGATPAMVSLGASIYKGNVGGAACTGCHGQDGAGTALGPDLTDQTWLWSDGSVAGIAATITQGVLQPKQYRAPMPAMGGAQLTHEQVSALAAYVWGLSHKATTSASAAARLPSELMIPGEKVYPESLTSTADGRVIIGSIGKRSIFVVNSGSSTAETFVAADPDTSLGILGVLADEKTATLWACFSPVGPPVGKPSKSALKAFDLQSGKLQAAYVLPTEGASCNDIAVAADGTTYVTDTNNMEIVRLKGRDQAMQVWAGDGEFGVKGGVLDGISVLGDHVYVNTLMTGKLFNVPVLAGGKAGPAVEVDLGRPLDHPDGMRSFGADQLLLIEGGGVGRLSIVTIGAAPQIATIKEGYPQGPVAVTIMGTTGYVLEGQLGALFGHPDPSGPKPFHATAVEIPQPRTGG